MKILVVCQYYAPEPVRLPDFCEEFVRLGHSVTVVTGVPNYPMGVIFDGYRNGKKRDEVINGVNVHRCFTIGRKTGAFFRFLNYFSFYFSSARYTKKLKSEFDVVFVNQLSPVMMANAAIKYKKKHNKKLVLYCLDLWPESLIVGGIKRGGIIYRCFHILSERIYKQSDKILITSKLFSRYFEKEFGITDTEYLPQYAESIFDPEKCRKEPNGFIDLMFAGNLGTAQSVETIISAARLTKNNPSIRWHIVGDGSEYENLKKSAEGLGNIYFYGRKPLEEMPEYYSMADAMLVTMQNNPVISLTLPGKVQSYMASGKPIIAACDGEANKIVKESECGEAVNSGDAEGLAKIAENLSLEKLKYYSEKSFEYYQSNFRKDIFTDKLISVLKDNIQ